MILALSAEVIGAWSAVGVAMIGALATIIAQVREHAARARIAADAETAKTKAEMSAVRVRDTELALEGQGTLIAALQVDNNRLRAALLVCERDCSESRRAWERERDDLRLQMLALKDKN